MNSKITKIKYKDIHLDVRNPRLSEFGINSNSKEENIIKILWNEMAVNELMYSIVSNSFWDYEPLIVIKEKGRYNVIEGNRRLAAVKLIQGDYPSIHIPKIITDNINSSIRTQTAELPCIVVKKREDSWKYVGFKHVNGPAKWGSYAKAKYIAEVHNDYDVSIESIAYQIGDTNKTAQKLYQGLMVLEQAKNLKVFDYNDIQANRIYFSHLYTGLQREGIRSYLDIKDAEDEDRNPVPVKNKVQLGQLLEWLFGSKKNDTQPLIKSQNPDLKYLDEVLQNKEATVALLANEPLSYAHELSRPSDALFEEQILAAKRVLQKARGYLTTGYKGEENLLRVVGTVAKLADDLYDEMEKIHRNKTKRNKKDRLIE